MIAALIGRLPTLGPTHFVLSLVIGPSLKLTNVIDFLFAENCFFRGRLLRNC